MSSNPTPTGAAPKRAGKRRALVGGAVNGAQPGLPGAAASPAGASPAVPGALHYFLASPAPRHAPAASPQAAISSTPGSSTAGGSLPASHNPPLPSTTTTPSSAGPRHPAPTAISQHGAPVAPGAGDGWTTHTPARGAGAGMSDRPFGTSSVPLQAENRRTWGVVGTGSNGQVIPPAAMSRSNKGKEREKEEETEVEEMQIEWNEEIGAMGNRGGREEQLSMDTYTSTAGLRPSSAARSQQGVHLPGHSITQMGESSPQPPLGGGGFATYGMGLATFSTAPAPTGLQRSLPATGPPLIMSSARSLPSAHPVFAPKSTNRHTASQSTQQQQHAPLKGSSHQPEKEKRATSFKQVTAAEAKSCALCKQKVQGDMIMGTSDREQGKVYHTECSVISRLPSEEVVRALAGRFHEGGAMEEPIKAILLSVQDGGPQKEVVAQTTKLLEDIVETSQQTLGQRFAFGPAAAGAGEKERLEMSRANREAWGKVVIRYGDIVLLGKYRPAAVLAALLQHAALPHKMDDSARAQHLDSLSFDDFRMTNHALPTTTVTASGTTFAQARSVLNLTRTAATLGVEMPEALRAIYGLLDQTRMASRQLPSRGAVGATVKASDMKAAPAPVDKDMVAEIRTKVKELVNKEATGPPQTDEELANARFKALKEIAKTQAIMLRVAREEEGLDLGGKAKWAEIIKAVMEKAHRDAEAEAEERGTKRPAEAAELDGQAAAKQQELSCRIPDCRVTGEHDHEIKTILPNGQHMPVRSYHHPPLRTRAASDDMEGVQPLAAPPSPLHRPQSPARGPPARSTSAGSPRRQLSSASDGMHVDE